MSYLRPKALLFAPRKKESFYVKPQSHNYSVALPKITKVLKAIKEIYHTRWMR